MFKFVLVGLFAVFLSACGSGSSTSTGPLTPAGSSTVPPSLKFATSDGKAYLLPKSASAVTLDFSIPTGINLNELSLSVDAADGIEIILTKGKWIVSLDGSEAAGTRPILFTITNTTSGESKTFSLEAITLPVSSTTSGDISSAGGVLALQGGRQINFLAGNALTRPVKATLSYGTSPNGAQLMSVSFDRNIEGSELKIVFPDLNTDVDLLAVNSEVSSKGIKSKAFDLTTTAVPYRTDLKSLGFDWLIFRAWYYYDQRIRVDQPIQIEGMLTRSTAGVGFSVEQKETARLTGVIAARDLNEDIFEVQPVLFIHGFAPTRDAADFFAVGRPGGQGTW